VTLISAWAVFAPGNIVVRLPWSLLLGLMMWYILAWSQRQVSRYAYAQSVAELGINILLGVTVLQVPLWIAKRALRYRLLAPGEAILPTSSERFQFQLKHMLIGTFIFAIALSPLRAVLPQEGLGNFELGRREWEMFVLVGAAICVNLIATLPCLWGGFVSRARLVPLGLAWLIYTLIVTGLEFWGLCAVLRAPPEPWKVFWVIYVVNATQGAVVFGVMRCYRALGYRLLRAPRTLPPPLPEWLAAADVDAVNETGDDSSSTPSGLRSVDLLL
jgi:hypothetical protein